ncbi:hypothetical protein LCGC14_0337250 [marine sediment metagenome]|uniref:Uncharacterized protein n=1 Tax=marine sediment metagenome TaxID=412755 RepID=A0A0F9WM77_9ZZZZ
MKTQEIIDEIDLATSPHEMSKEEAIDFMRDIVSDIESKIECLEMESEDDG